MEQIPVRVPQRGTDGSTGSDSRAWLSKGLLLHEYLPLKRSASSLLLFLC